MDAVSARCQEDQLSPFSAGESSSPAVARTAMRSFVHSFGRAHAPVASILTAGCQRERPADTRRRQASTSQPTVRRPPASPPTHCRCLRLPTPNDARVAAGSAAHRCSGRWIRPIAAQMPCIRTYARQLDWGGGWRLQATASGEDPVSLRGRMVKRARQVCHS